MKYKIYQKKYNNVTLTIKGEIDNFKYEDIIKIIDYKFLNIKNSNEFKDTFLKLKDVFREFQNNYLNLTYQDNNISWSLEYLNNLLIKYYKLIKINNKEILIEYSDNKFIVKGYDENILDEILCYEELKEMLNNDEVKKLGVKLR